MQAPGKSILVRELLWLLGILVVSLPLSLGLHQLARLVPVLRGGLATGLPTLGQFLFFYGLAVLGCYLLRLGVVAAERIATTVAPD